MAGLGPVITLLKQFFPPDLSPRYLQATLTPLGQTLEMAAGGIFMAVVVGLAAGIWVGAGLPGGRAVYTALGSIRSIPDLTLAILCVVLVGIGPPAGMLALAIFYSAAIGKIFSDLFRAADRQAVNALRATGASRLSVAWFGLLPLRFARHRQLRNLRIRERSSSFGYRGGSGRGRHRHGTGGKHQRIGLSPDHHADPAADCPDRGDRSSGP